ncbi:MAG TPA: hypothetical protein VEU62_17580 [Bryobacterales bacterium]|nr:hypothetical protein [Bryobacterales bacterium]
MAGYQRTLLGQEIDDGRRLIDALKKAALRPRAALWCYFPDTDEWRLAISTPLVDRVGYLKTYERIGAVMSKMKPPVAFTLSDISAQSPHSGLTEIAKATARAEAPSAEGFRFVGKPIGHRAVEEAYVYSI